MTIAPGVHALLPDERDLAPARGLARVPRTWAERGFDGAVLVLMLSAVWVRQGHEAFPGAALLVFSVAAWLPLLARTRWPMAVLVSTVVVESLHLVLVPVVAPELPSAHDMAAYQPVPVATMAAAWTVATRLPRQTAMLAGGVASIVLPVVALLSGPQALLVTDMVMCNLVLIATGAGVLVNGRRERVAREAKDREDATRTEVVAERMRIARDLHDVLAHHLTLVNAQASVAGYLLTTDPRRAATALSDIDHHTRRALDELRATVGLLRQDRDGPRSAGAGAGSSAARRDDLRPMPGLDRLDELVAGLGGAGAQVGVEQTGAPVELVPGADLAAYRIVQEALTNAAKHAPGAPARVVLTWTPTHLALVVQNRPVPGRGPVRPGPGTGHGLIGMRERALACGGTFAAGRVVGGGFVVCANLPVASVDGTPPPPHPAPGPRPGPHPRRPA